MKSFISIHAPPRGATQSAAVVRGRESHFNSRPSARGDKGTYYKVDIKRNFNSRPSARGDVAIDICRALDIISIHAPPRGATPFRCAGNVVRSHFNSRPSARGDVRLARVVAGVFISIHAPPRGATPAAPRWIASSSISIHAPPRGATPTCKKTEKKLKNFNSRPSARGDRNPPAAPDLQKISIHAPPRGATELID